MVLFNYEKAYKQNVFIGFKKVKDLQAFLDWAELINSRFNYSAKEYFKNDSDLLFNVHNMSVKKRANIKDGEIVYEIEEITLHGHERKKEVIKLNKEIERLVNLNQSYLFKINTALNTGAVNVYKDQQDLISNISVVEKLNKLIQVKS